jgi:hypothetical protein
MLKKQPPQRIDNVRGRQNILRLYNMEGGLNTATDETLLLENESPDLLNCHTDKEGALVKRDGYTKYNATTLGSGKTQGAAKFYKLNGTEHILVAHGGNVYVDTAGAGNFKTAKTIETAGNSGAVRATNVVTIKTTAAHGFVVGQYVTIAGVTDASFNGTFVIATTPLSTTLTYAQTGAGATSGGGTATSTYYKTGLNAANNFDFCQGLVGADEVMVISDRAGNLQKYTGTAISQLVAKAGSFPVIDGERLFVVEPTDLATVYASKAGNIADFTTIANAPDTDPYAVTVGKGDGDIINGLAIINDQLAIFKRKRIAVLFSKENSVNFSVEWAPAGVGCTSPDGLATYRGIAYFPAEDGVYTFDGSLVKKISDKISSTYKGIGNLTTIVGECYDGKYYMAYTPAGGSTNSKVLVYDIDTQSWWKYDGMDISSWMLFDKGNDTYEFYGCDASDGFIYKMFDGTNDAGSAINFYWISKWNDFSAPERKKRFRKVYTQFEKTTEAATVVFGVNYDFGTAFTKTEINTQGSSSTLGTTGSFLLGTSVLGSGGEVTSKISISGQQRWIQYRVSNNAADAPVVFKGVSYYWKMKRPV